MDIYSTCGIRKANNIVDDPTHPSHTLFTLLPSGKSKKIEKICQTFTSAPTSPTLHRQDSPAPSLCHLSTIAAEEILQIIQSCNPTTCTLDRIPYSMLQTISLDHLFFITTVINGSIASGHVPTTLKRERDIPILKKPVLDPSDISNYSPNKLQDPNQSGFKAARFTETALLAFTEKLHAARSAKLSLISGNMDRIDIDSTQTLHWCPTRLSTWSSPFLPLY
ncbi:hypothetical protein QTP86_002825 [Hemibagrus guttatus]|nr:hypothetical protein QTP86_002825 [Hemibagrus guttatus]